MTLSNTARACSIPTCHRAHYAKALCNLHYKRQWRNGDPTKLCNNRHLSSEERLLLSTIKHPGGCWDFTGKDVVGTGHRRICVDGASVLAHRHAYTLWIGPIPVGMWVLHKCDNPQCVNPEHLEVGDRSKNVTDMWARGGRKRQ